MAIRRKIGNLASFLLQSHLARKDAEYQSNLVGQRQKELAGYNSELNVLEALKSDPKLAARFAEAYPGRKIGDIDTSIFVPTADQAKGALAEEIQKAPDKFDPLSIINQYNSSPGALQGPDARQPIEQLIAQRNSAFERSRNAAPSELRETVGPDGSKSLVGVNPQNMSEPLPTALDPVSQGMLAGKAGLESWMANEGDPLRESKEVSLAGRKSYAQGFNNQTAQLKAEGQFYSSAEGLNLLKSKAQAALTQAKSQAEGAVIVKSTEQVGRFLPNVLALEEKWAQAQPEIERLAQNSDFAQYISLLEPTWDEGSKAIVARTIQSLPATVQQMMSPRVRQYFEMRQSYMPIFARVLSEVGNLNDQEQLRAVGLSPSGLDALEGGASGTEKMDRMKKLLITMPDIQAALFRAADQPPAVREQIMKDILQMAAPLGSNVPNEPDPSSPRERFRNLLGGR